MPHPTFPTASAPRLPEIAGLAGLCALGAAWLVPDKFGLWIVLWNEAAAVLGLLLLAITPMGRRTADSPGILGLAWPLAGLVLVSISTVWAQWTGRLLQYGGDAWLVSLYLGLFTLALMTGRAIALGAEGRRWVTALLLTVVTAGVVSAMFVLMQWLWVEPSTAWVQGVSPGRRPYANLGQPNQANTLFFLALCSVLQLRREKQIGATGAVLAAAMLTLAMSVTQSRTGIVQLLLLAGWCVWLSRAACERGEWRWGVLVFTLGAAWWALMPWASEALLLPTSARDLGLEQASSDARWKVWHAFLDAALQRPWGGYGWLQSGWAQESVAACHPDLRVYFSYAHLLPLDWVVWLGFPLGLGMLALLLAWLWPHLRPQGSAASGYWMAAVLGLLVHAMLEYPLAYTYFLLPLGLMMGVIDAHDPVHRALRVGPRVFGLGWLALCALSAGMLWDAGRATSAYTDIRFENARIGAVRHAVEIPDLMLLDHLQGLLTVSAAEVSKPLAPQVLDQFGAVVRRFPSPSLLRRYATVLEVSGEAGEATRQQQLLCDMFGAVQCRIEAKGWHEWQRYQGVPLTEFKGRVLGPRCAASTAPR